VSASTPVRDLDDARRFTEALGVEHLLLQGDEFDSEEYRRNDRDRCYHCKAALFRAAQETARERGRRWIMYGYNATDRADLRPGHRAALEYGVVSPLADSGLGKQEIRSIMRLHGLDLAMKAASPCLSSRIMTGIEIDPDRLADVEALEGVLRRAGVEVCRARICDGGGFLFVRIVVASSEFAKILECRGELDREGRARGYRWVTVDLGGYRTGGGTA